jgi:uroporphyrinogen-III synthase
MRIFVFRPPAEAERTAAAIRAHGHEPVLAPLFAVSRLPEPAPEGPFSAIVLTSGNAVPALADLPPAWQDLPVFAVGGRTAGKVREAGFEDARSAQGNRDDMVTLIRDNLNVPARLLLIVGRDRHEDVADKLNAAGFEVATWVAYAAEAIAAFPEQAREALRQGGVDGALHYSARGVRTCLALAREAGVTGPLLDLTHVALSADVAAPLISAGASTVLVAEHPEEAALLAALDQVSARNRGGGDVTEGAVAPDGVETDKDAMHDPETPSGTPDGKPDPGDKSSSKARSRSGRTPPTIELTAQDAAEASPAPAAAPAGADVAPEAVLPTEALPQEFTGPTSGPVPGEEPAAVVPPPPEPARSRLPALALAGLVGGVVGAGLVMLAMSRTTPAVSPEQIAVLQSRLDTLQSAATELDRKAASASDAAAKAGAAAQAATARFNEVAAAQAPDAAAIAGLNAQAQRAEAAAGTARQMLEQASARIGNVETLAKAAAAPSPQALAAARIVLAERVQSALASGQPFAGDVAALAKGGGAPEQLAALNAVAASGAPTRDALLSQLRTHRAMFAREIMPASAGWQDRLLGLASRVVSIRPVGDTGANDPATLPMRLENAVAKGDIVAAAALWAQLPEPARRASADFGQALQKRAAADAAIAKIAQDAVTALGVAG